jgi:hypothetical protein
LNESLLAIFLLPRRAGAAETYFVVFITVLTLRFVSSTLQHKPTAEEISAGPRAATDSVYVESTLNSAKLTAFIDSKKVVKLEICAGAGDWIITKAEQEPQATWFALEIRYDRAHEIWRKLKMKGLSNVYILIGDAKTFTTQLPLCVHIPLSLSQTTPNLFFAY